MPIRTEDIKIFASERMTDNPDGGGRITGTEIVDGASNNIFPDVSDVDTAYGRVALRLVYPAVRTDDTAMLFGARLALIEPPEDPIVSVVAFQAATAADARADARNRIESYVTKGPASQLRLLGDQLRGQRVINCYQRPTERVPEIGEVYALAIENDALPSYGTEQYVRVASVETEQRTFTQLIGNNIVDFEARVIALGLENALRHDFPAADPTRTFPHGDTVVRETQVTDAASYKGTVALNQAGAVGDLELVLESIYRPIVPTTQSETPVADVQAGGSSVARVTSGGETFEIPQVAHTHEIEITLANRGYSFVPNLQPIPAPGALTVSYRALGKWYSGQDDGSGNLTGYVAGTVDYQTGTVTVTLRELPDVGTSILFAWATTIHYNDRAGSAAYEPLAVTLELPQAVDAAQALTLTWTDTDGTTRTATSDSDGVVTGDATGQITYETGEVELHFNALPAANSQLEFSYAQRTREREELAGDASGDTVTYQLSGGAREPGTVIVGVDYYGRTAADRSTATQARLSGRGSPSRVVLVDDGAGGFSNVSGGSIDYQTGEVVIPRYGERTLWVYREERWQQATIETAVSGPAWITSQPEGVTPVSTVETVDVPPFTVRFLPAVQDVIVPGTVRFRIGNQAFSDRSGQGVLYLDDGTVAGSIDYATRTATLEHHDIQGQADPRVQIDSMVSTYGDWWLWQAQFRTPGAPVKPTGFNCRATTMLGELLTATADSNGTIAGDRIDGHIDYETGVTRLRFGELVDDASLTAEEKSQWWYDPADVDGNGQIFRPEPVLPSSVTYNVVVLVSIPLDADQLGLDPVRLPPDGRVPIVRRGDLVMVHHTQRDDYANLSPGQTLDAARVRLARAWIEDATGAELDPALYTLDLNAGTATLADPLDLSAYSAPFTFLHRIEDLRMVGDVEINGRITVTRPLSHAFPADESYCSSVILGGDRQARYTNLFDQMTWTGEWSDSLIGDEVGGAAYNDTTYPIEVTNRGAVTERWALVFTSSTSFRVIGETVGEIAIGDVNSDTAPTNPNNGQPYFRLRALGWGSGWSTGNVLRFNTLGTEFGTWLVRTVLQGDLSGARDDFRLALLGNVNAD
ncbi:hypothetical protein [Arhodomonas sp. AD133]|uniref:hypothetical protein n=1 Tax=Arhodomonas sp. AD133 TaxID=3415009 RepID=UPI003EBFC0F4